MNDLSREARAMIDLARDGDVPTRSQRRRIKRSVLLRVAAVGAVASSASGAAAAGVSSLAAKIGVVVVTASLLGGGAVAVGKLRASNPQPAARSAHASKPEGRRARPPEVTRLASSEPALGPATEPMPSEHRRVEASRPVRRPAVTIPAAADQDPGMDPASDPVQAEVSMLARAREELRNHRPREALRALAEYDHRFPRGALAQERQAIAAIATCQVQPGTAARAQAEEFLRRSPDSPLADRVRAACTTAAQ